MMSASLRIGSWFSTGLTSLLMMVACNRPAQKARAPASADGIWKEYAASLNAGDVDRWLALWTDDGIQMPPDEPPVVGKEKIRARNGAALEKFKFDIAVTNQELTTAGDWAYSRGVYRATLTPKQGGPSIPIDGKFMTILARQPDGSWKIHRDIFNSNVPPPSK
jgi:uncharacterized protein (TIGR02246 family)